MSPRPTQRPIFPAIALLAILLLALAACSQQPAAIADIAQEQVAPTAATEPPPAPTDTAVAPTDTPTPAPTATATPTPEPTATATDTPPPTDTPTPAPTATPTTPPDPFVLVTADLLNVRSGPGTVYPRIGQVRAGDQLDIVAKAPTGNWLQVCCVDEETGWLSGAYVEQGGRLDEVAVAAEIPPTPTPPPAPPAAPPAVAAAGGPAPSRASSGFFGYGIQIDPNADIGRAVGMAQALGMQWVKVQVAWENFEPSPGAINWGALDNIVGSINNAGLSLLFSIPKAPAWARPGNTDLSVHGPPADPGTYANFVGALANRYRGRVQAYEIWNEQNMWYEWGGEPFDAGRYVRLLCRAYSAIKGQDGGAIVVSGAPTPTGAPPPAAVPDRTYLRQMYNAGLRGCSDAIGVHPSGYGNSPDSSFYAGGSGTPSHNNHPSFYFLDTIRDYRSIMQAYGDGGKRLWATEFGWASVDGMAPQPAPGYEYARYVNQNDQANYLVRAMQIGRNSGYMGVMFIWNLNYAVSSGPQDEKAAFGLVKPSWDHRPAFDAISNARRNGTLP